MSELRLLSFFLSPRLIRGNGRVSRSISQIIFPAIQNGETGGNAATVYCNNDREATTLLGYS